MSKLTTFVTLFGLHCTSLSVVVNAEDTTKLNHWHRWYSLAVAAQQNKASCHGANLLETCIHETSVLRRPE